MADYGPVPFPPQDDPDRRVCGNCIFAVPGDGATVTCLCFYEKFSNHAVPNQRFPPDRGGCIYHQYNAASRARYDA